MSFKDLLGRKLGPMQGLVGRPRRPPPPEYDPAALWYRRAAGLEIRARPEESYDELEVRTGATTERYRRGALEPLLGLTRWTAAADLPVDAAAAWNAAQADLLYFARFDPGSDLGANLPGRGGALAEGRRIARHAAAWPTGAVETAVQVSPMPFMPRGRDLEGASLVGLRAAVLSRGHEVFGATITGGARTGAALRDLWPRLNGRFTEAELLEAFPRGRAREDAARMLALLDALTLLEPVDGPPGAVFDDPTEPQVTWLGHAALLVQAGGTNLLIDPLFHARSAPEARWTDPPEKPDPRSLPRIDAVFVTHGDNDHLNPNTLLHLPRETPVYVPRTPAYPPPHQTDLRGQLRVLGFETVRELDVDDVVGLPGLTVTACPFEGEDWDLELAQLTYLVESPGLSVFASADAGPMPEVYRALAARGRPVDLACLGVSGAAEPMVSPPDLGYGNFYADWVPRVRHNEWVRHCAGPAEAAAAAEILKPRFAFGYAAGGTSYVPMAYCDVGDHAELAARLEGSEVQPVSLPLGVPVTASGLAGRPSRA